MVTVKEPLINSESFSCAGKMCQIKAPIAGKTQSNRFAHGASFSQAIAKIGNAELAHFNKQMLIHELIRGSLISTMKIVKFTVTLFADWK
jgi:hypothetical protein